MGLSVPPKMLLISLGISVREYKKQFLRQVKREIYTCSADLSANHSLVQGLGYSVRDDRYSTTLFQTNTGVGIPILNPSAFILIPTLATGLYPHPTHFSAPLSPAPSTLLRVTTFLAPVPKPSRSPQPPLSAAARVSDPSTENIGMLSVPHSTSNSEAVYLTGKMSRSGSAKIPASGSGSGSSYPTSSSNSSTSTSTNSTSTTSSTSSSEYSSSPPSPSAQIHS